MQGVKVEGLAGYVTVKQAAEMLGIGVSAVHWWLRRDHVPAIKLGNSVLIRLSDIQAYRAQ